MDTTLTAFELILHAGESRSQSLTAVEQAEAGEFENAKQSLELATESLNMAHKIQTDLIQEEARGEKTDFGLIMVHAQDHLTMATLALQNGRDMLSLYKRINELERKLG